MFLDKQINANAAKYKAVKIETNTTRNCYLTNTFSVNWSAHKKHFTKFHCAYRKKLSTIAKATFYSRWCFLFTSTFLITCYYLVHV